MSDACLITDDLFVGPDGSISPRAWRHPRIVTTFEHPGKELVYPRDSADDAIFFGASSMGPPDATHFPTLNTEALFTNNSSRPVSVILRLSRGPTVARSSSPHLVDSGAMTAYGVVPAVLSYSEATFIDAAGGGVDAGSSGNTRYFANQETYTAARTMYGTPAVVQPGQVFRRFAVVVGGYSETSVIPGAGEVNELSLGSIREDLIIAPII